jgi:hypothetical protein
MKQRIKMAAFGLALVGGLFAGAATTTMAASDNANGNACFGQDRATFIAENGGKAHAEVIKARAGDNAQINAEYRENCQAESED